MRYTNTRHSIVDQLSSNIQSSPQLNHTKAFNKSTFPLLFHSLNYSHIATFHRYFFKLHSFTTKLFSLLHQPLFSTIPITLFHISTTPYSTNHFQPLSHSLPDHPSLFFQNYVNFPHFPCTSTNLIHYFLY